MRLPSPLLCVALLLGLVSCNTVPLEERARALHDRILTIDTHCDTPFMLTSEGFDGGVRHEPGAEGSGQVDLPRMAEGGLDAAFFAVYTGQRDRTPEGYTKVRERADLLLAKIHELCEQNPELAGIAVDPDDAVRLEREGKRAIYIGMENGYPIGRDLAKVEEYYHRGVRYITLCHVRNNDICDSSTDDKGAEHDGLSDFGRQVVGEMNRLGCMVDVSHISDAAFYEVLEVSRAPVLASHSCCRALCDNPRNLTDHMIKALAARGGVLQMCILSSYVKKDEPNPERDAARQQLRDLYGPWSELDEASRKKYRQDMRAWRAQYPRKRATVADTVDHIAHVIDLVGIDYIGIGTDFDGGGGLEDCDDVTQLPRITEELLRRGYSEGDIKKIWSGNLLRVFRAVQDAAADEKRKRELE